ncbi:ABC transporter ATP-binding protein [Candidatus Bipolaricaulota bacterium]|nr:ABC transporter ATP-binding protein [Candidatus Bipolaricaulota bacterium]
MPKLKMEGITKRFPGVLANKDVDFELRAGEVVSLLGENGAGKSTLMNVLYGMYERDGGQIYLNGEPVDIESPNDAMDLNIGMVHQHFMLIPVHTVAENIILGMGEGLESLELDGVEEDIRKFSEKYGLEVDPQSYIHQLPVGVQQRVEIIKALYRGAEILILDEPTAVLTPQETEKLFDFIESFREEGNSVIFITHKLNEAMEISDRITVLRGGKRVGTVERENSSEQDLAKLMVGEEMEFHPSERKGGVDTGSSVLEVKDLTVRGDRGNKAMSDVSFEVNAGEIFGVAGVSGNGQTELCQSLTGLRDIEQGEIFVNDEEISELQPKSIIKNGVGYIPDDRQNVALSLDANIEENLVLKEHDEPPYSSYGVLQNDLIEENARTLIEQFDIKASSPKEKVKGLSGGNQQKAVVAREISIGSELLIAFQPTRGLDVGAARYVEDTLAEQRDAGKSILLISTKLPVLNALADRIGVLYEGEFLKILPKDEASIEEIGLLMAGVQEDEQ